MVVSGHVKGGHGCLWIVGLRVIHSHHVSSQSNRVDGVYLSGTQSLLASR
jgi:hypothetical protein